MQSTIKCAIAIRLSFLYVMLFSSLTFANTQVIGLKINDSSIEEVRKVYSLKVKGEATYSIDAGAIPITGVKDAFVGFHNDKLKVVGLKFSPDKFDYLFKIFNEKYKLYDSKTKRSDNRYAIFKNDGDLIIINSPFKSFYLEVTYVDEGYNKKVEENSKAIKSNEYLKDKNNL
ncbi:hypothetical protein PrNR1418_41840 (plasmid) [Providencia rettgeri]|uniref:hypothetical protein n=1 Tax=Providencia sp. PROV104 TaxID=2949816 RepID=UPI001A2C6588|nr:hypothetical protein [Providencia sp. PROV104]EIU7558786.1 hypothetical protein [Providencia rettgeri]BDH20893.1 hypothetical protein PrNR1418_41840 [Providencia rettgeri]